VLTRGNGSEPCAQAATVSVVSADDSGNPSIETLRVRPNPATHEMTAVLKLRQASGVALYVVNTLGQRVATLAANVANSRLAEGTHEFPIPSLVAGSYRCVAEISVGAEPLVRETWMFVVAH
jgi:hypothetical protein